MPLRFEQDKPEAPEPIAAVRPPAGEDQPGRGLRLRNAVQPRSEKASVFLKMVVGGIFTYVGFMALGLCGMIFPHQSGEMVRAVRQAMEFVRPAPPNNNHFTVVQVPATDPQPKTSSGAHRRLHKVDNSGIPVVEIVDSNQQKRTVGGSRPAPSVTVSVTGSDASEPTPAN